MAQQRFEVKQTGFDQWRLSDESAASLTEGEVRLAVDFFAFTANNMTYAAAGDMLGYWKFFPVAGEGGQALVGERVGRVCREVGVQLACVGNDFYLRLLSVGFRKSDCRY